MIGHVTVYVELCSLLLRAVWYTNEQDAKNRKSVSYLFIFFSFLDLSARNCGLGLHYKKSYLGGENKRNRKLLKCFPLRIQHTHVLAFESCLHFHFLDIRSIPSLINILLSN